MNWWDDEDDTFDDDYYGFDEEAEDCGEAHDIPPDAYVIDGPIHAINRRGEFGTTWLGKQWISAVNNFYVDNRLHTGRTYARNGSVQYLEISYGRVFGQVQGSQMYPYCTTLQVKIFDDKSWSKLLAALNNQAAYAASLLVGEMPPDVEAVLQTLHLSLIPKTRKDLIFSCTCPDYGNPCKHAAAIYYLLVEQVDADPFALFHLFGRTRDQVLEALNVQRAGLSNDRGDNNRLSLEQIGQEQSLALTVNDFDTVIKPFNLLPTPIAPAHPPLFDQYGEPPADLKRGLETIYLAVTTAAKQLLEPK